MNREPRHILLIDDNELDRAELRRMLLLGADRRYRFTEAASGAEAMRLFVDTSATPFDCVLLDFHLPDMNAVEVLAAMRQGAAMPPTPVLVITGGDREHGPGVLRAGAQDYVGKEWSTPHSLAHAVDNAIERFSLLQALELAKASAEKANLAKSEFLSHMSHELRSPLNSIIGFAQLLETGATRPTPLQADSIDQILRAGWHLLELVNDVLDLAVIESGKAPVLMHRLSLAQMLSECQAMMEPQARKAGIRLRMSGPQGACFVRADRRRAKQVFINLLTNAIKYNRAGGAVDVSCRVLEEGYVRVSFQDTGHGLSAEKLADVFQPFNRLGQEAGAAEGSGIGLAVCQRLMASMNGRIGADSELGRGSVFRVDLELAPAPHDDSAAPLEQPTPARAGTMEQALW